MTVMLKNEINVYDTYSNTFTSVTEKLTGLSIRINKNIPKHLKAANQVVIQTKGAFPALLICSIEESLREALLMGMNRGRKIPVELRDLYLGEYINIICGHALTKINNKIGGTSRLSLPQVNQFGEEKEAVYLSKEVIYFDSNYGQMKLEINYGLES